MAAVMTAAAAPAVSNVPSSTDRSDVTSTTTSDDSIGHSDSALDSSDLHPSHYHVRHYLPPLHHRRRAPTSTFTRCQATPPIPLLAFRPSPVVALCGGACRAVRAAHRQQRPLCRPRARHSERLDGADGAGEAGGTDGRHMEQHSTHAARRGAAQGEGRGHRGMQHAERPILRCTAAVRGGRGGEGEGERGRDRGGQGRVTEDEVRVGQATLRRGETAGACGQGGVDGGTGHAGRSGEVGDGESVLAVVYCLCWQPL